MGADLLIINIKGLVQVRESTPGFIAGADMARLPVLSDAFLSITGEKITGFGPMSAVPPMNSATRIIDAAGSYVVPSFVDSHTHLVFAATREEEFVMKIKGSTYAEIASRGGGILNSAKKIRDISEDELFDRSLQRINEIISTGTGAVEVKSGYGLTTEGELKMLRVAKRLGQRTLITVKTTFLGAHAVPEGWNKEDYIKLILQEMIPAVAEEKLADYIDVFCEQGFFAQDETEKIIECGKKYSMKPRIHANQLHRSGGVQAGVRTGALSVDHLENIGKEEIALLMGTTTMPTALPGAAFFLNLPFPPVREMIHAGLPVAIASDYNPGSAPSGNMPLILSLACIRMKMTPEEAINASTINTAYAIELLNDYGSITVGKMASVFITKPISSLAALPYSFGSSNIARVILKGKLIA